MATMTTGATSINQNTSTTVNPLANNGSARPGAATLLGAPVMSQQPGVMTSQTGTLPSVAMTTTNTATPPIPAPITPVSVNRTHTVSNFPRATFCHVTVIRLEFRFHKISKLSLHQTSICLHGSGTVLVFVFYIGRLDHINVKLYLFSSTYKIALSLMHTGSECCVHCIIALYLVKLNGSKACNLDQQCLLYTKE